MQLSPPDRIVSSADLRMLFYSTDLRKNQKE
jgi:hypothetical protein